jgi:23S rRNA (guanine2445-N2)-methyltransferase / 23S rRNA (guanine2069-N7)-methyltransferase
MHGDFDLARDHAPLLRDATARLAPGGVLYFVHHVRRFELDTAPLEGFHYKEISAETVAEDFTRSPHQAWRIEKPA